MKMGTTAHRYGNGLPSAKQHSTVSTPCLAAGFGDGWCWWPLMPVVLLTLRFSCFSSLSLLLFMAFARLMFLT